MSAPSPCYVMQTSQREFAGAKVVKNKQKMQEKAEKIT